MVFSATRAAITIHMAVAIVLLGGCAPEEKPQPDKEDKSQFEKNAIAEAIESRIELPEGAGPLDSYGRNYAFADDGTVVAVYVAPLRLSDAKEGESLWHDSRENLPWMLDGGCAVISVSYNPGTQSLIASCNGVA